MDDQTSYNSKIPAITINGILLSQVIPFIDPLNPPALKEIGNKRSFQEQETQRRQDNGLQK
jgi:hypothetical protein